MSNTYTQIHIHTVFAVRKRANIIQSEWKEDLYRYLTAIIQNYHHKVIAINGTKDHVHILFGMRTDQSLSNLMQHVKGDSSKWINEKRLTKSRFEWQEGYGPYSYSRSQIADVISYIQNQEKLHQEKTFIEEYRDILNKFSVPYKEGYIFQPLE